MSIFRNEEIKLQLLAGTGATALCSLLLFFFVSKEAAGGSLLMGLICVLVYFWLSCRRYKDIKKITEEMDEILHGNYAVNLAHMKEGDMEILRDEIQKLIICLREQNECILKEKRNLADSLADISHQIRTPLTSLNLMLEKVRSEETDEAEKRKCCREMERMLNRIEWLITSLLKMAKLEAGTVVMEKKEVKVAEIVREAFRPFEIAMELRGQEVVFGEKSLTGSPVNEEASGGAKRAECADGVTGAERESGVDDANITVACDRSWTIEAVANVVKNSMEHTPSGGTIHADWRENPLFTEISIQDSGEGIREEDMQHLFERFYRGKQSDSLNFGIGLAFVRLILAGQDAVIFAENGKDGGARFVIRFYKTVV